MHYSPKYKRSNFKIYKWIGLNLPASVKLFSGNKDKEKLINILCEIKISSRGTHNANILHFFGEKRIWNENMLGNLFLWPLLLYKLIKNERFTFASEFKSLYLNYFQWSKPFIHRLKMLVLDIFTWNFVWCKILYKYATFYCFYK